jgi:hypothetical protein
LFNAVTALGLCPAIYRRNNHLCFPGPAGCLFRRTLFAVSYLVRNVHPPEKLLLPCLCRSTAVAFKHQLSDSSPFLPCLERHVSSSPFRSR